MITRYFEDNLSFYHSWGFETDDDLDFGERDEGSCQGISGCGVIDYYNPYAIGGLAYYQNNAVGSLGLNGDFDSQCTVSS